MTKKWIIPLVLILLLTEPTGFLNASLDEGGFVPCYNSPALAAGGTVYHTVRKGDTLWDICGKYRVDLEQVKEANNLDDRNILTVGDQLLIPGEDQPVHRIKDGETLWDVARTYRVSLNQIYTLNPGIDAANLKVGDALTLPRRARLASRSAPTSRGALTGTMLGWPVIGAITSAYGWRSSGFHHGLDISAQVGDPVRAAASGTVSFCGIKGVYGKMIIIDHPDGRQTVYAHLKQINVAKGRKVSRGETIGKVGITGNSTGPHLHFEVRRGKKTVNPASLLR